MSAKEDALDAANLILQDCIYHWSVVHPDHWAYEIDAIDDALGLIYPIYSSDGYISNIIKPLLFDATAQLVTNPPAETSPAATRAKLDVQYAQQACAAYAYLLP
jgi:hypothetical protein